MENKSKKSAVATKKLKYTAEDYMNHPYFLKKDEDSRNFIRIHGFPEELVRIRAERLKKKTS